MKLENRGARKGGCRAYRVVCSGKEGYGRNEQPLVDDQDEVEKRFQKV